MKRSKSEVAQAWAFLEHYRHAKLHAEVMHVSRSGMSRVIKFLSTDFDDITWAIARITDNPMTDNGLRVGGCGMDMCFAVISSFNYAAAAHDLEGTGLSWNTEEGREKLGIAKDSRIYDDYFFNANRL